MNYALSMQGVEVALFFRELPDGRFRVSLRSKGHVNVAASPSVLVEAGTQCASGCALDGPLSAAAGSHSRGIAARSSVP